MQLSVQQESAMDKILDWRANNSNWMFYLGGYAGTGKTTLLQEIINRLNNPPICLAPTGKAASVLQKKLAKAAVTTIHSALYKPVEPDTSKLEELQIEIVLTGQTEELRAAIEEEKRRLSEQPLRFIDNLAKGIQYGDLVIVDEASMVTRKMANDLMDTGAQVLFVGDPGQLPPVKEAEWFQSLRPDAMLYEIHRQALDNPIIELSMKVRKGEPVGEIDNEHIWKRNKAGFPITGLMKADQILTGMNSVRRRLNRAVRKIKGLSDSILPVQGEKLICLKNQYARGGWIVNGMQCFAASDCRPDTTTGDTLLDVLYEGQLLPKMDIYPYPFEVHYNSNLPEEPWSSRRGLAEFDFGYAITVHKSQGSEWDRVILVDDGLFFNQRENRKRWLYTAVTRAKEHLTWLT